MGRGGSYNIKAERRGKSVGAVGVEIPWEYMGRGVSLLFIDDADVKT